MAKAKVAVETETLTGLLEKLVKQNKGTSARGKWTQTFFILKLENGEEAKCNTFSAFDNNLLGQWVTFEATYNDEYKNYSVKGDIELSEGSEAPEVEEVAETTEAVEPEAEVPVSKLRKPKAVKVETAVAQPKVEVRKRPAVVANKNAQDVDVAGDYEALRPVAEKLFQRNAEFVARVLGGTPSDEALVVGIQAYQALHTSLSIETNKRTRVANFQK